MTRKASARATVEGTRWRVAVHEDFGDVHLPVAVGDADGDVRDADSYVSSRGWRLVTLSLQNYRCEGPSGGGEHDPYAEQEFAISPAGAFAYLGAGLRLVDAGDYDNDGHSEMLFAVSGYDAGGYVLFYADFTRHADLKFAYH